MNAIRARIGLTVMSKQEESREQLSNYVIDHIIEKSLKQAFGEASARLIYDQLERNHHLTREDIPKNLEMFFSSIEEMYGFGAKVLKRTVLKKLHTKLGLKYEEKEGYNFSDYIRELKTPKHPKVDEKAVIRPEDLDTALTSLPKLKEDNTTTSGVIKKMGKAKDAGEQQPEPAGGDRQDKKPKKRIQQYY